MDQCLVYAHPINPLLLVVLGLLLGLVLGLLLAVGLLKSLEYLDAMQARRGAQEQERERSRQEQMALELARREAEMESAQDAAIICSVCWEERHPGHAWPSAWGPYTNICGSHYNGALLAKMQPVTTGTILAQQDHEDERGYALAS